MWNENMGKDESKDLVNSGSSKYHLLPEDRKLLADTGATEKRLDFLVKNGHTWVAFELLATKQELAKTETAKGIFKSIATNFKRIHTGGYNRIVRVLLELNPELARTKEAKELFKSAVEENEDSIVGALLKANSELAEIEEAKELFKSAVIEGHARSVSKLLEVNPKLAETEEAKEALRVILERHTDNIEDHESPITQMWKCLVENETISALLKVNPRLAEESKDNGRLCRLLEVNRILAKKEECGTIERLKENIEQIKPCTLSSDREPQVEISKKEKTQRGKA